MLVDPGINQVLPTVRSSGGSGRCRMGKSMLNNGDIQASNVLDVHVAPDILAFSDVGGLSILLGVLDIGGYLQREF